MITTTKGLGKTKPTLQEGGGKETSNALAANQPTQQQKEIAIAQGHIRQTYGNKSKVSEKSKPTMSKSIGKKTTKVPIGHQLVQEKKKTATTYGLVKPIDSNKTKMSKKD